jgi:3-hydroxyisobutyrate dehydrogenase-like beta-hydroxyacid dehydrogenase
VPLVKGGAKVAGSVLEAVQTNNTTVVCVLDYAASNALLHEPQVSEKLRGKTVVQLTTGTPRNAQEGAAWAAQHEISYLDGAIMSYPAGIGTPDCTILYAGSKDVFDAHQPLLSSLAGNTSFVGENPGNASTLDGSILSFYFASQLGFLHGAALCESEGFPVGTYREIVTSLVPVLVEGMKASEGMINKRSYQGAEASLNVTAAALGHVLKFSSENAVDSALTECLVGYLKRAIAKGYGNDELPAVFEAFRKTTGKDATQ